MLNREIYMLQKISGIRYLFPILATLYNPYRQEVIITRQMLQASWGASLTTITCVYIILCVISVCYSIVAALHI